jgi:hypothetical protein
VEGSVDASFPTAFDAIRDTKQGVKCAVQSSAQAVYDTVLCPKCAKPFGLAGKNAIHRVTLLENNPLLSASRALWLAFLPASAAAKLASTEPQRNATFHPPLKSVN